MRSTELDMVPSWFSPLRMLNCTQFLSDTNLVYILQVCNFDISSKINSVSVFWVVSNVSVFFVFRLYRHRVSWQTALHRCQQVSAYLVSINSVGENNFVSYLSSGLTESSRGSKTWIGLGPNYHYQSPHQWVDGSAMTYHRWYVQTSQTMGGKKKGV